jgi:hypothetical protein
MRRWRRCWELPVSCCWRPAIRPLRRRPRRTRLSDHTAEFNDGTDQRYQVVFNRSGFTQIVTPSSAEYGRWVVDDQKGLCLQKDGSPQICAPLYQLSVSHYKWGETSFNLVDAGFRAGFPFYYRPHL